MATARKDWEQEWKQISKESRKLAKRANQRLVRLERYAEREGLSDITKFAYAKAQQYIKSNLGVGASGKGRYKENVKLYDVSDGSKKLTDQDMYKANVMIQRARIKAMQEFLGSQSSTLGVSRSGPRTEGIKKIYDKRTQTLNRKIREQYGAEFEYTDQDLKRFFDSKKQAKLEKLVSSSMMFVVAKVIKKNNLKSNKRDLEKFMKSHIDLEQYDLSPEDIKARKGESYRDYLTRLQDFIDYTSDENLNAMVNKALKEGINVDNIFI